MSCTDVQTIQAGNGTKTQFSFDFPYIFKSEIHVYFWNATTKEWDEKLTTDGMYPWQVTDANPTIVEFTSTAPPAPATPVDPNETAVDNVRIRRETNIEDIRALFNPGSAIRSDDLNNNFEQLRYAIQESNCQGVTEDVYQYLLDNYWDRFDNTLYDGDTWVSDDTKIATSEAIDDRVDNKIDLAIEGDINIDSTGLTKIASGGQVTLGIGQNSVDLDRIKNEDIITYAEQNAGSPSWNSDSRIPTTYASARRHDCLVQTSTPTGSDWQVGKMWVQNDTDRTVHIWDGTQWLPIASGGAFTTLPKVVYVDSINGDDSYEAHRLSNPKKTIKSAIDDINADPNGDGSIVVVAPGIYGETFPIDIQKNDVAVVGTSLRNVIIHPAIPAADQAGYDVDVPESNELQIMFRVNSGSYFYGLTLQGMKASGTRGGNALDTDATYGLPTNQGWNFAFYPGATIKKSPYIQNCTNFSDSQINNVNFTPHVPGEGAAGDLDSGFAGGGILIDGSTPASNSPLRSMVCDSYTHTALNGPGIFVTNNGYCQATSSYSFFNHFHLKTKNGGQANLAASTTDFGNYSLIADGRSTNAIFTAATTAGASTNDIIFTINAPTAGPDWHGSATRPQDNMLVDIGGYTYPVLSAVAAGSGWTVTISRPDPANLSQNLGLQNNVASGASANFYLRSMIASSGHTMEYVGSGTDYRALPENGGVPNEARQKTELNNGKIWAAITDHKGKFIVGDTFSVDQQTGFIETGSGSFAIPRLIVDLDLNGNTISDSTGNVVIDDTLSMNSNKIVNVTDPTAAQDAATKAYVDALETSLEGGQLDNLYFRQDTGETINSGDTWSSSDLSIATTAAIDARIVDLVDDVGGFVPINNENSFPATNPDINDGAGTLISIQEISTSRTPSGGTVTIANGSGSNTVTINNCGTTVLAAGYGCIVETTTTLHTYNFHRLTPLATEVSTVAANVTPINTVATNISDVTTVSTDIASVVTVANDLNEPVSEIDTVATNITNVNNVGNNITDVTTVSGSISNVNTVASDITNVNNTGTYIANVNTVAGQISPTNNVATVAGVASSIPTVASVSSSIPTVAGIAGNVTTVAGISGNVTIVAGISSDVTAVANNNTDVSTVATNITDVNTFANRYRIASSDPTTSLDTGDLVFNTTANELRVYNGTAWQGGVTATGNLVSKSGDTMTGDLSFGGTQKVTNLATPTATGDAATKGYVDTAVAGAGTVTSVATGTGLTGGPITSTGTISLANTAVTAGSYTTANITVDAQGRITAASNGTSGVTDINGLSDARATTTGYVHLGGGAGGSSSAGTALGNFAGNNGVGGGGVYLGRQAGYYITGNFNTFVGEDSGLGSSGAGISPDSNTGVGYQTLYGLSSGDDNVAVGFQAGRGLTSGGNNSLLGWRAGYSLTAGASNVAVGREAGYSVTTGSSNVFVGKSSGGAVTTGINNTIIGTSAGGGTTTSSGTTAVGYNVTGGQGSYGLMLGYLAGSSNITGAYNIGLGYQASIHLTSGGANVHIGYQSGVGVTTGLGNVNLGHTATSGLSGTANVIIGYQAGNSSSTGAYNIGLGMETFKSVCTGNQNIGMGYQAMYPTSGSSNIGFGQEVCKLVGTGSYNVGIGSFSLKSIANVDYNTALGYGAGTGLTSGTQNIMLGAFSGGTSTITGSNNTVIGYNATSSTTSVSNEITLGNTSITKFRVPGINFVLKDNGGTPTTGQVLTADASGEGYWATLSAGATSIDGLSDGYTSSYGSVGLGANALANDASTTGKNTAVGEYALTTCSSGYYNTAVGWRTLNNLTTGYNNIALGWQAGRTLTTGYHNVVIGENAGYTTTTAGASIYIGSEAGYNANAADNVCIGRNSGKGITTASSNIYIGNDSGYTTTGSYNVGIGYQSLRGAGGSASSNSCLGYYTGYDLTTGGNNSFVGLYAGNNVTTGSFNTFLGANAGASATTHESNTYVGYYSGAFVAGNGNTAIGENALRGAVGSTAGYNVSIGQDSGRNISTGSLNVFVGINSGRNISTTSSNTFVGTSSGYSSSSGQSVFIGNSAGYSASGNSNVVVGYASGNNSSFSGGFNTILGGNAGTTNTTGTFNTVIGYGAEPSSATVSNEITLGGTGTTKFRVPGVNFVLKDNGGTPTAGQVLTADSSGEGYWATPAGGAGTIEAFVNYAGNTSTIHRSGNVSSLTNHSTGNHTINFTSSLSTSDYCVVTSMYAEVGAVRQVGPYQGHGGKSTSSVRVATVYANANAGGAASYDEHNVACIV